MQATKPALRIGELAARAGVRVDTVRFYEKRGLLPRPTRLASGYRSYDSSDLDRLRFIRRSQELGFTLDEIDGLLRMWEDHESRCSDVKEATELKLADVEQRIADLERIRAALTRLRACCDGDAQLSSCPLLECLRQTAAMACGPGGAEGATREASCVR